MELKCRIRAMVRDLDSCLRLIKNAGAIQTVWVRHNFKKLREEINEKWPAFVCYLFRLSSFLEFPFYMPKL